MSITIESLRKEIELLRSELAVALAKILELEKENSDLRLRLSQDSSNSSKPPSSDPLWKRGSRNTSMKNQSKKKRNPGGQKGHKGYKLKKFEYVDYVETHKVSRCPDCNSKDLINKSVIYRQVIDIPKPIVEVTEHEIWQYKCGCCGKKVDGGQELGLTQEAQYGQRLKSLVSYLSVYQLIPYKRLTELIDHLFDIQISQGTISNFNKELQKGVSSYMEAALKMFIDTTGVIHSDETGCMVDKELYWIHVYCDELKTLLFGHVKRGKQAMQDIGILDQTNATVIHDRFHSYLTYDTFEHGLCNAHILRELNAIKDMPPTNWPSEIKQLLLKAKSKKEQKPLSEIQITRFVNKYETILRNQRTHYQKQEVEIKKSKSKRGKPKRSKDHNLFIALWKLRTAVLKFITNPEVPFDNNQAERDFRMTKIKMKISNQFKTEDWLHVYNDIRSYISTAMKQKLDVLDCIYQTYQNPNFATQLAV